MKNNSAARRLLGMNHWRSNTQFMQYVSWHVAAKTGKPAPGWIACERAVLTSAISPNEATESKI
ncbi:TPA: hypothetical protein U2L64_004132 [Citrobacter koseri]|uniref:hypothetical protein n=1 Tax=Citrobacter koseri TaxID=545 RepID=UPI0018FF2D65|nr:hypothetical protein [Citrobacter koseri]MBJ9068810.1 hypothetical protein [Citrobacter koseri]HEM7954824.1 hypothetical protein [Citrobacter koseri]HEM7992019.1 hypothetical protein [Citrobacter koseri]